MANLLLPEELAERLKIHPETLKTWRAERRGPVAINIATDAKPSYRYDEDDVEAWLTARKTQPALRA